MSCLVLSYLSCLVVSCLVLSYLFLSCLLSATLFFLYLCFFPTLTSTVSLNPNLILGAEHNSSAKPWRIQFGTYNKFMLAFWPFGLLACGPVGLFPFSPFRLLAVVFAALLDLLSFFFGPTTLSCFRRYLCGWV